MPRNASDGFRAVSDLFDCAVKMAETLSTLREDIGNETYSDLMQDHPDLCNFIWDCRQIAHLLNGSERD
jgi:hypothetical protein